jgi:hypothetical protein
VLAPCVSGRSVAPEAVSKVPAAVVCDPFPLLSVNAKLAVTVLFPATAFSEVSVEHVASEELRMTALLREPGRFDVSDDLGVVAPSTELRRCRVERRRLSRSNAISASIAMETATMPPAIAGTRLEGAGDGRASEEA